MGDFFKGGQPPINTDLDGIDLLTEQTYKGFNKISTAGFFTNATYGDEMNQNPGFSGTPVIIHNGRYDGWTASAVTGTWDFTSGTRAKSAIITVNDYTGLSGDTITITSEVSGSPHTITEGVDFNAVTSNAQTAENISAAIDTISGFTSLYDPGDTAVHFRSSNGFDISNTTTTAGADLTIQRSSIDFSSTTTGDQMIVSKDSGSLDFDNYVAITGSIYLTSAFTANTEIYIQGRLSGALVGDQVLMRDYITETRTGSWQNFVISKLELGLAGESVDDFIVTIQGTGANAPNGFLNIDHVEEIGGPIVFSISPPAGYRLYLAAAVIGFADEGASTNLSYDKFFTIPELTNGVLTRIRVGGVTIESLVFRDNYDFISLPGFRVDNIFTDGTNVFARYIDSVAATTFPIVLNGDDGDSLSLVVNDDLSGLLRFKGSYGGYLEAI